MVLLVVRGERLLCVISALVVPFVSHTHGYLCLAHSAREQQDCARSARGLVVDASWKHQWQGEGEQSPPSCSSNPNANYLRVVLVEPRLEMLWNTDHTRPERGAGCGGPRGIPTKPHTTRGLIRFDTNLSCITIRI